MVSLFLIFLAIFLIVFYALKVFKDADSWVKNFGAKGNPVPETIHTPNEKVPDPINLEAKNIPREAGRNTDSRQILEKVEGNVYMNKCQKNILIGIVVILGLMLLFPPFKYSSAYGGTFGAGYSFIFLPPRELASIDVGTLFIQYLIIITIGAILFYIFRETGEKIELNNHQKNILITAAIILGLMILFPPFHIKETKVSMGYSFISSPPNWPKENVENKNIKGAFGFTLEEIQAARERRRRLKRTYPVIGEPINPKHTNSYASTIDIKTLLTQCVIVVTIGVILCFINIKRR